jgi:hypothetical protein
MIGVVGLFSVVVGAIFAYASDRHSRHIEAFETLAGFLVLTGFAAAGYALSTLIIA